MGESLGTPLTLTPEQLTGTWRAADGGAVTFTSDGRFSLSQVPGHYLSDDSYPEEQTVTGKPDIRGTWTTDTDMHCCNVTLEWRPGPWQDRYHAYLEGQDFGDRQILRIIFGDPDSGDFYDLVKQPRLRPRSGAL